MTNDKKVVLAGDQNSNLNQKQIDLARSYLTTAFGNYCGAGSDNGEGCGRTVQQLKTIWEAKYLQRNEQVPFRQQPFLVVNEKYGYGLDRFNEHGKLQMFGNVNYYCRSCNMMYNRRSSGISGNEKTTYQSRKSHEVRPAFKNDLLVHLDKCVHTCLKATINKWSGHRYNCSQELLENALDQELDVTIDLIDTQQFSISCDYPKCNGTHIIRKNVYPEEVRTDYSQLKQEEIQDE